MCLSKNKGGMGFCDMEVFNLTLLARQGWRLINDNNSLLSRMLKARYFPRSDFIGAKIGFQPSYAWRSLLRGREILAAGTRWCVGNGTRIRVFGDRWLPRPSSFLPLSNPHGFTDDLRVSDIIDWDSGGWDPLLVREILHPSDAELVLQMRLISAKTCDELVWHYSKDGEFSVRSSAYHLGMEEKIRH